MTMLLFNSFEFFCGFLISDRICIDAHEWKIGAKFFGKSEFSAYYLETLGLENNLNPFLFHIGV